MKQKLNHIYMIFFAALFVALAFMMHRTVVQELHSDVLVVGIMLTIVGPLSLVMLAACAASAQVAYEPVHFKVVKRGIVSLATLQLLSIATYLLLIWKGE
tara:strand:- start:534 stop:833 length:300 start_codon:yes stop_codon:yes gene_type:complete